MAREVLARTLPRPLAETAVPALRTSALTTQEVAGAQVVKRLHRAPERMAEETPEHLEAQTRAEAVEEAAR